MPLRYGGTLIVAVESLLERLVEDRWEAHDLPQGVLPQNWGGIKPIRTITCKVLKATANDRRASSPLPQ
ncbi:hypothetical protein TNCV_1152961 [Trichonephila clavipes]|nr:hypothetical protein TNCV_1152961 [Trichonephila clavipes]